MGEIVYVALELRSTEVGPEMVKGIIGQQLARYIVTGLVSAKMQFVPTNLRHLLIPIFSCPSICASVNINVWVGPMPVTIVVGETVLPFSNQ